MDRKLIVSRPNGDHTAPLAVNEARSVVEGQARKRGNDSDGYRLRIRDGWEGEARHDLANTMDKWEEIVLLNDHVGDVVVLDLLHHPYSIVSRWVDAQPPIKQTSGNDDIDLLYTWWHTRYPQSRNAGICVYKKIAGTSTYSQHCYRTDVGEPGPGANAFDEFLETMEEMYDGATDLAREGFRFTESNGREGLPVGRLIIGARMWTPEGWDAYHGNFHYHLHAEGRFWLISGSPKPCP